MVGLDEDRRGHVLEIEVHRGDLGRLEAVHDQDLDRLVPTDDVDLLAEELIDDVLDSRPTHADARTDAVDVVVVRRHRDLRAIARLAGDSLDLDHLLGDLGDLELEERADEIAVRTRKRQLDAIRVRADVLDEHLDALTDLEAFAGRLLAAWQESLDAAEVDDEVRALVTLDDARDERVHLLLELLEDAVALRLADLLEEDLLGVHRGEAAEIFGVDLLIGVESARLARLAIDLDANRLRLSELLLHCGEQSGFHAEEHDLLVDLFRSMNRVDEP